MEKFTSQQIETLRKEFSGIERVSVDRLDDFREMFAKLNDDALKQLTTANIKFVSKLAVNACLRRGVPTGT